MMFEPEDRVKLAELPREELEEHLHLLGLNLHSSGLLQPGEEALVDRVYPVDPPRSGCNSYRLAGRLADYYYPEAALQHACLNWQMHRELRRAAATTEVAPTGVDRSAYLTGMTESEEVR